MTVLRWILVVALVLSTVPVVAAQEEAPQPTPEHEQLGKWVGSWSGSGELKPGAFGPGGSMQWTEDCSWFGGNKFHVVCKSKGSGPTGPMEGIGFVGYNPEKKVFTHYGVDSNGWSGYAEGTRSGDTWTFNSTEPMQGKTYHSRFKMTLDSPTAMTFTWELSEDGENWTTVMDGSTKKK